MASGVGYTDIRIRAGRKAHNNTYPCHNLLNASSFGFKEGNHSELKKQKQKKTREVIQFAHQFLSRSGVEEITS